MTDETPSHQPTYDTPQQSEADQQFYCRVECSCGEFQRTAKSKVSGAKARGNARSAFGRHLRSVTEPAEPAASAEPAEAAEPPLPGLDLVKEPDAEEPIEEPVEEPVEPVAERVAQPEPPAAETTPAPPSRRPALLMAAGFVVVLLALVGGILVVHLTSDNGAAAQDPDLAAKAREVRLPELTTRAEYGRYLRKADPVFKPIKDAALTVAGKRVCRQYSVGLNVVEISSSMIGRGVVDSRQAAILISAAVPVFCPRFAEPVRRELSGLA